MTCCFVLRCRSLAFLAILSAVPIAFLLSSYFDTSASSVTYRGDGYFRECTKWDPVGKRFLASTLGHGTIVEIRDGETEERVVIRDAGVAGNGSVGLVVDQVRNRLLVVYGDSFASRYSGIGAYRLDSWERIFLTWLGVPADEPSMADDVAVDPEGNAYVTDAKSSKIWKVDINGKLVSTIRSDVFKVKEWYKSLITLNGILYHQNGYFLVIHTTGGRLFKVDASSNEVSIVNVKGSLLMGDGMEWISPNKIVVSGFFGTKLVESDDEWVTGRVTGVYKGPFHRIPSAAAVKDGKVYVNHLVGGGFRKLHVLAEAVFTEVK